MTRKLVLKVKMKIILCQLQCWKFTINVSFELLRQNDNILPHIYFTKHLNFRAKNEGKCHCVWLLRNECSSLRSQCIRMRLFWGDFPTLCRLAIYKTITWGKISKRLYSHKNENDLKIEEASSWIIANKSIWWSKRWISLLIPIT